MATTLLFDRLRRRTPQIEARALNRAIVTARKVMVTEIRKDVGLPAVEVRKRIRTVKASPQQRVARLFASYVPLPLVLFKARGPEPSRGRGQGVTAQIGRARARYPHAFLATMRAGHRGVFERKAVARLPIRELRGPSVAEVFLRHVAVGWLRGEEALRKNLQHEFAFALKSA